MKKRESISKKIRFEIFKRDNFKCQYCGSSAPHVLLHIDHIKPVSKGGTNVITNLITACESCNGGKSNILLDSSAAIDKQRIQLESLQKRREQLEMMMQWHDLIVDEKDVLIKKLSDYWLKITNDHYSLTTYAKSTLKKLIAKHDFSEIIKAIDEAAESYFKYKNNVLDQESTDTAFDKIPGIIRTLKLYESDPDLKEMYYIRGIIKNRCNTFPADYPLLIEWMKAARSYGASMNEIKQCALTAYSINSFSDKIDELIAYHK